MAVQFADKALDEWLTIQIQGVQAEIDEGEPRLCSWAELKMLKKVQKQLHAFWGSALETKT